MGEFISFGNIEKKYIYIISAIGVLGLIFIYMENNSKILDKKRLMDPLMIYIGYILCFIPELIRKRNTSIKKNNKLINRFKYQKIFVIGITALLSLIHNYLILTKERYVSKEEKIILHNNYAFFFLIIFIISKFLFKYNYYRHQYISISIIIIIEVFRYFIIIKGYMGIIIFSSLNMKIGFLCQITEISCYSFYFIYSKLLMEKYYFSPYESTYIIGIINGIITLIIFLILSLIPIDKNKSAFPINYNNKFYIDNIGSFSEKYTQIFLFLIHGIINSINIILFNIIIQYYTIGHIFLPYQLIMLIYNLYVIKKNNLNLVQIIEIILSFIVEIFISCIFLEIIELNFCGLNKNIKKNIQNRASNDIHESLSPIESYEINDQFIFRYSDQEEIENINVEMKKLQ